MSNYKLRKLSLPSPSLGHCCKRGLLYVLQVLERNQFSLGRLLCFVTLCIETGVSCVSSARWGQTQPSVSNETILVKAAIYFSHLLVPAAARALRVVGQFNILDKLRPWLFSLKVIVRTIMSLFFFFCMCVCQGASYFNCKASFKVLPAIFTQAGCKCFNRR